MSASPVSAFSDGFIEPIDVLSLRGNRLFGEPGSYGESRMPPNPSVVSGALRSALLVHRGVDLAAFAGGRVEDELLGRPDAPGPFTVCEVQPARLLPDASAEPLFPVPADLVVSGEGEGGLVLRAITPVAPPAGLAGSHALPLWAALAQSQAAKPQSGLRLTADAWQRHLAGTLASRSPQPAKDLTIAEHALWRTEMRVGIALDAQSGRADDGKLFSTDALSLMPGVGLLVRVAGAPLADQVLRLGGDGHGARLRPVRAAWPQPDLAAIVARGRARLILTSPGVFAAGWLPSGAGEPDPRTGAHFDLGGVSGRIVCAATPRGQVISGFDLVSRKPKPARRAAAIGSVYWIDDLQATPDALGKLAEKGLWQDAEYSHPRRAEGFNRFTWAAW
jgi:CRISPR-associated protein Cmr3